MAVGQAHRRPYRPQRHRLQRATGRRRWVIERTMSWLTRYRRLNHRYERHPRNYLAFLGLASALCCYKRFLKLTM
ncbi:transposase [Streptomyces griseoaurantiacus]|uniref:transposase n=1 Tax=Streptomyces griseoaurantiacus TaxID=68213 RepID=UPI003829DFCA